MSTINEAKLFEEFRDFVSQTRSDFDLSLQPGGHLSLCNSGRRGDVKEFNLGLIELKSAIDDIIRLRNVFAPHVNYDEKQWRDLGGQNFTDRVTSSLITVQTKPFFTALSKTIDWANGKLPSSYQEGRIDLSENALNNTRNALNHCINASSPVSPTSTTQPPIKFTPHPEQDNNLNCLVKSLLTKSFVILTGASGTGKTQLAEGLARHYAEGDASRFAVVAVGADWTDNRHVLGFVNHLHTVSIAAVETPVFQSTPVLDLLLRAANDRENKPYFLVLDEMNLSHVERYFADFLSAMERREGTLQLHSSQSSLPRSENDTLGVPQEIPFPRNLFVIGTVNVDETTYMFSPKVLDRANVIEFRMKDTDLQNFLNGDGSLPDYGSATSEEAQDFFRLASSDALDDLPEPVKAAAGEQLQKIFAIMEGCRFEFGYRAAKEVMRFLKICRHLAEDKTAWDGGAWLTDMDTQILQKLMPRLHGGKARMVPLLTDLGYLCHGTPKPAGARLDTLEALQGTAKFPRSFEKIRAMAKVLIEEQFVSFIC
jgi:energy-coupling factor transporter ATP-binding protein EcfA2